MLVSRARSEPRIARTSPSGSMPESTASATLGPMPLIADQPFEERLLERRREAEELQRILADVRVDAKRHARADVATA